MPRYNTHQISEKTIGRHCKIRKRVSSSSSSSSSSVVKNYRFKRAILVGKRTGSSTPVPTWKVIMAGSSSPLRKKLQNLENGVIYSKDSCVGGGNIKGKEALSARKLAATLWEINGLQSPGGSGCSGGVGAGGGVKEENFEERKQRERGKKSYERVGVLCDAGQHLFSDQHPHSPICKKIDGSKVGGHRRRSSTTSQTLQITEYIAGGLDTVAKASSIEVTSHTPGENNSSVKARLKDVNNTLIASKELVKVLYRMLAQEDQHSSSLTLVSALRVELDRARTQVDRLVQEQRSNSIQIDTLMKQFTEEKAAWKSKEKERVREAVSSTARELEIERKLRRQAERLNKKLGTELGDTRAQLSRAVKELEAERRAREILEQTCDELARGIGEERVEVEEMKRESAKVQEEVEKERQMLQLADVLREERVQMKLAEARYEYEEKNAALERLKSELEIYLRNEASKENKDGSLNFDGKIELKDFLDGEKEPSEDDVDDGGEDSGDSELHSIELNMENKWNFACDEANQGSNSRRASFDEVFKGRRSLSEKIQWESICLQRKTTDGVEWDSTPNKHGNVNGFFDKGRSPGARGSCGNGERNEHDIDDDEVIKRFEPVKSRSLPSAQGPASPALREACSAISQDLASRRRDQLECHSVGNKW